MKKTTLTVVAGMASATLLAGIFGDTPDAKHAWAVHDANRPIPVKVTPGATPGAAPSDAVVLFDGTKESFEKNWCDTKGGPTKWKFVDGTMESVRSAGNICSRQKFGDCQLHVEWQPPAKVEGHGQGRGNSGVFVIDGQYEIQVLDSYETDPANMKNPNYADGMAGAVYGQNPPMVNPSRPTPEWQTYDIIFHGAVWDGNTCVHPPTFTVFFNGVLVQDHWEVEGPTGWRGRPRQHKRPEKGSIQFQDHGNPVHFRNVWVREIPSRYANTTHGTYNAKDDDVKALRREIAAKLFGKIDLAKRGEANNVKDLMEVLSYDMDEKYVAAFKASAAAYRAALEALSDADVGKRKNEINGVWENIKTMRNNGLCKDCPFGAFIEKFRADHDFDKKK